MVMANIHRIYSESVRKVAGFKKGLALGKSLLGKFDLQVM
jgi:hypothetical protein